MKVDFHVHTTAGNGKNTPAEMAAVAKKKGLDAIAITDLDTLSGWKNFNPATFMIIPGVEIATEAGHVLLLGAESLPESRNLTEVRKWAEERGYLVVPAHFNREDSLGDLAMDFDILEAINGRSAPWECKAAVKKVMSVDKKYLSNSGAHSTDELGDFYNNVHVKTDQWRDVLDAVREGNFEPRVKFPSILHFARTKLF